MKKSNLYLWLIVLFLFLADYAMIGQEITVHNLPKDSDFSTLKPRLFNQDGEEKLFIAVIFAHIGDDYIYLNDDQVVKFDHKWVDQITLVKNSDLFKAMNYQGSHSVVVFDIKKEKRKKLFKAYL